MSKWTETRDEAREGAKKAWESAPPTTQTFFIGVGIGVLLTISLSFIVWAFW